ncbi:MAG TPA: DUF3175 domain-containing protein [Candidatus Acidoferrales bacterium]|nr:DUF3175 domain-containing protein [Candidatus Acidoferrales bacterium]
MSDATDRWSQEITERDRHDLPEGVFASGSAQEIADAVLATARGEEGDESVERRAMAKLTFYENRAGRNLSPERRQTLEDAKAIVRESS